MAEVIWTEPALNSLDEIGDYIAIEDYDAACRLIREVFEKINLLEATPQLGNVPKELKNTPYRRLVIKLVYVYYRIEDKKVIIIFMQRAEREFALLRLINKE